MKNMLEEFHQYLLRQTNFVITKEDETHASQQRDERTISIVSMGFCPIIVMEERWLLLFCACVQIQSLIYISEHSVSLVCIHVQDTHTVQNVKCSPYDKIPVSDNYIILT